MTGASGPALTEISRMKGTQADLRWFWAGILILVVVRIALTWSQTVTAVYGPHDDTLYATRAMYLLKGQAFGPYTSTTLVKYPGLSLVLAFFGKLGIPYLAALNFLFVGAVLYFTLGLLAARVHPAVAFVSLACGLFNPFSFDLEWTRLIREPFTSVLFVLLAGGFLFVFQRMHEGRGWLPHLALLSAVLAIASITREEDVLLYSLPVLAAAYLLWRGRQRLSRAVLMKALWIFAVPVCAALLVNAGMRAYIGDRYGLPILHDYGEGEFPKLIVAMRSVQQKKDNRYVMISRETLDNLQREIPLLRPVIRRLPLPAKDTPSCVWLGVCSETANGWLPFWLKDAAFEAGFTPNLVVAQRYFRTVREQIERACEELRLACRNTGSGFFPPFELRWTRAFVTEWTALARMLLRPDKAPRTEIASFSSPRLEKEIRALVNEPAPKAAPADFASEAPAQAKDSGTRRFHQGYWTLYSAALMPVMLLGFLALACMLDADNPANEAVCFLGAITVAYLLIRITALAYIAIYMGRYEPRMVLSPNIFLSLLTPALAGVAIAGLYARFGKALPGRS